MRRTRLAEIIVFLNPISFINIKKLLEIKGFCFPRKPLV